MKRKVIFSTLLFGALFSNVVNASGTINFTGNIIEQTCEVTPGDENQIVNLGDVAKSDLDGSVGKVSAAKRFSIGLVNCPESMSMVAVRFAGTPHSEDANILALSTGSTPATGVGVALYEVNDTFIPLNSDSVKQNIVNNAAQLDFVAKYRSTSADVTAGSANAVTNFTLVYN